MKVELWPIARVKPYEKNPRHNDGAVDAVAASLREYGFRQPIVVDAEGVIIVGHTRWKAAHKLGLAKVPVHVAKDLTPQQIKAYRIADNKTGEIAEWNLDLLPIELSELQDAGFDMDLLGFDSEELATLMDPGVKGGLTDPDDVPLPPDEAITQPGDLWVLGDHRLALRRLQQARGCGSATRWRQDSFGEHGPALQRQGRAAFEQRHCRRSVVVRGDEASPVARRSAASQQVQADAEEAPRQGPAAGERLCDG